MKKITKKYPNKDAEKPSVEEVYVPYDTTPKIYISEGRSVDLNDFRYGTFKAILDKSPFTISEWARLLYISERTMHRYAKENLSFNGLQAERILLLEELIDTGIDFFGKEGLAKWIHSTPFALTGVEVFDRLFTHQGIQESIDALHRIQNGIPA